MSKWPPFIGDEQNRCIKCGEHPTIIFSEIDVYETTTCTKCAGLPMHKPSLVTNLDPATVAAILKGEF